MFEASLNIVVAAFSVHTDSFPRERTNQSCISACQVDAEDMSSKCKKVANIDSILLGELRKNLPATIDP